MSLPSFAVIVFLGLIAFWIWIGYALVRSARLRAPTHSAVRACPDPNCRHHNPAQAEFCAKCGRRLTDETA